MNEDSTDRVDTAAAHRRHQTNMWVEGVTEIAKPIERGGSSGEKEHFAILKATSLSLFAFTLCLLFVFNLFFVLHYSSIEMICVMSPHFSLTAGQV